ncbi:hypothetical protein ACT8ZV_06205 [Nocardioides sp. MAHUQ-72]|uniref:hypothetical protein n=1 Tax=unclassified Nocardioides TaxID=2615069 RepID=UPI0036231EAB
MSRAAAPGSVTLRTSPLWLLLPLAACGFIEAGLVVALLGALAEGSFSVDGAATSPAVTAVLFLVLSVLALLLGVALVALVRSLFSPPSATVLTADECRQESGGEVRSRVTLADATALVHRPALNTTWKPSGPGDPTVRGVSTRRLHARLELRGPAGWIELTDSRSWVQVVDVLRGWARARPELVSDPDTAALLLPREPVAAAGPGTGTWSRRAEHERRTWPRTPFGLVWLAVRTRDPWAPFLPDVYGLYSPQFGGRMSSARAARPGKPVWLLPRWWLLLSFCFVWAMPLYFVWLIVTAVISARG